MMSRSSFQTRAFRGSAILILLFLSIPAAATSWYVRSDGGNASQCTGLADAAYSGSGTGQACAWNHPFVALPPEGSGSPRIQGGDTLHIGSGDYMMGYGAPNTDGCYESGSYECYMSRIPSGPSPSQPTRILGAGHDQGCTQAPELWGTERAWMVANLEGSSNVELACLEITDRSSCILSHCNGGNCEGEVVACKSSGSGPFGDWATTGISARDSSQVVLKDVNIHGLANRGIHAGRISDWMIERTQINANGWIGWDGDLPGQDSSNSGAISFLGAEIGYNGCAERWPGGEIFGCWGQKTGGYGDGLGVGESGGHWIFEDSTVHHNTSDGIDLLYLNDHGKVTIRRTLVDSNAGNQVKVSRSALIENSVVVGNCSYFSDEPNMLDGDHCRALGDTVFVGLSNDSQTDLINNTIVGEGNCLISGGGGSTASRLRLTNNLIIGKDYWLDPSKLSCLYYSGSSEEIVWDRNFVSNVRNGACPGNSLCGAAPGIASTDLGSFDPDPLSSSPLIDAASTVLAPSDDFRGWPRPAGNGPDIGAIEHAAAESDAEPSDRIFGSRFN